MTQSSVDAPLVTIHEAAFLIAHVLHKNADNAHTQARDAFIAREPTMTDAEFCIHTVRLNRMLDQCEGLYRLEELARDAWEVSADDDSYEEYKTQVAFHDAGEHRQRYAPHDPQRGIKKDPSDEDNSASGMLVRDLSSILNVTEMTKAETTKAETAKPKAKKTRAKKAKTARTKKAKTAKTKKRKTAKTKKTKTKATQKATK